MIVVEHLSKTYDSTLAVRDLSFPVSPGQVLGLVGPNGAGKTTTMRAIAGIVPATSGTIQVAGHDVQREPVAAKQQLAYIPDDPQLFDALTVREHLDFFAAAYQVENHERRSLELVDQFGLTAQVYTPAGSLSRGMRQKLAICCGYLHDPAAILFDEPFTGLDPLGIRRLKASIEEQAGRGAAIVVSSHLLAMVDDICTHYLILSEGQSRFLGDRVALRQQYGDGGEGAALEEIFFLATGDPSQASSPLTACPVTQ